VFVDTHVFSQEGADRKYASKSQDAAAVTEQRVQPVCMSSCTSYAGSRCD
jgi:hypothetical protein